MAAVVRRGSGQSGSSLVADRWSHMTPTSDQAPGRPAQFSGVPSPGRARRELLRRLPRRPIVAVVLLSTLWLAGWGSEQRLVYNGPTASRAAGTSRSPSGSRSRVASASPSPCPRTSPDSWPSDAGSRPMCRSSSRSAARPASSAGSTRCTILPELRREPRGLRALTTGGVARTQRPNYAAPYSS